MRYCCSWLWLSGLLAVIASAECCLAAQDRHSELRLTSSTPELSSLNQYLAYPECIRVISATLLGGHSRRHLKGEILGGFLWLFSFLVFAWGNFLKMALLFPILKIWSYFQCLENPHLICTVGKVLWYIFFIPTLETKYRPSFFHPPHSAWVLFPTTLLVLLSPKSPVTSLSCLTGPSQPCHTWFLAMLDMVKGPSV